MKCEVGLTRIRLQQVIIFAVAETRSVSFTYLFKITCKKFKPGMPGASVIEQ